LRRIIIYAHHPSATYFEDPNGLQQTSLQLDTASNFILWLLGKPHDPVAFQRRKFASLFSHFNAAPIPGMRLYVALEKKREKNTRFDRVSASVPHSGKEIFG
jgi:hypothetical protein